MNGVLVRNFRDDVNFDEDGNQIVVTVVATTGNVVVGKRTAERDGYSALVLGYGERRAKTVSNRFSDSLKARSCGI